METIKYVIVDDNTLAHSMILRSMEIYPNYECIGQYYNVMSATTALKETKPQVIFLDVEMPHLMGFELIKHIDKAIKVVITTSYRKFAYESYVYAVFDSLKLPAQNHPQSNTISLFLFFLLRYSLFVIRYSQISFWF